MPTAAWDELSQQIAELDTLAGIGGLLGWDQQVAMSSGSAGGRAQQRELIGRLYHEQATSPRLGELIEAVAALPDSTPDQQPAVRNMRRTYRRATCVPSKFARRIAKVSASDVAAWGEVKKEKIIVYLQRASRRMWTWHSNGHKPWTPTGIPMMSFLKTMIPARPSRIYAGCSGRCNKA